MDKKLFLIDGSSFLYRAYYGMRPLHTPSGQTVQAVYGFCRMLKKLINQFNPEHCVLVWDSKGPTIRHELFANYKATRQAPPSDLFAQKEYIKKFAEMIKLPQVAQDGVEADDLMYSLAKHFAGDGFEVILITSDKDLYQVLGPNISLYDAFKEQFATQETFERERGFPVNKIPFYHALLGDSSDNIPGAKGIGKKGALELVQQFNNLDDLYNRLNEVKSARAQKALLESRDNVFLSHKLFLLHDVPVTFTEIDLAFDKNNWALAAPIFQELQFKSLLAEIGGQNRNLKQAPINPLTPSAGSQGKPAYRGAQNNQTSNSTQIHALEQSSLIPSQPSTPSILEKNYDFKTIRTEQDLITCIEQLKNAKIFAFDTETDGLAPLQSTLVGMSFCHQEGSAWYLPLVHTHEPVLSKELAFKHIKPLLEDPAYQKILQNAKFDLLVLEHAGIKLQGLFFDTMIAASLTQPEWQKVGLKALSESYLNERMLSFKDVVTDEHQNFTSVPLDIATAYASADAHQTYRLWKLLEQKLKDINLLDLYYRVEHPLIDVLVHMEREGIPCDETILKDLDERVTRVLRDFETEIHTQSGLMPGAVNLNSPRQLEQLLFGTLGLPPKKKSAKKTGYSTDAQVLAELSSLHIVPKLIMRHRELFKIKSSYLTALPQAINPETKKIHTSFNQVIVATGRLASSEPNLQNIPVSQDISVRSAFYAPDGYTLVSADYSQIELRVLAFLSGDEHLKNAFVAGHDIHAQTAAKLFDATIETVTAEQRSIGKRINFSIMYGQSAFGLSRELGISSSQAKEYIDKYFAQYPGVSSWVARVIEQTKKTGYTSTWLGRRRMVPGIYERNKHLFEAACRIAINTPAQGTAAEIMKLGMIKVHKKFLAEQLPASLVLQIHDELLVIARNDAVARAQEILKSTLESIVQWDIPLLVTMRTGKTWEEVTK